MSTAPSTTPAPGPGASTPTSRRAGPAALLLAQAAPAVAVAVVVAVALTALSGARTFVRLGLPDPGAVVTYGLPVVRALAESAAVLTVGALLLTAFLVPPVDRRWLSTDGYRGVRIASWCAGGWAAAAIVMVPLSVADAFGQPLTGILDARTLVDTVPALPPAAAWGLTAVVALVVLAVTRTALSWGPSVVAFTAALVGLLPVALTGHSASGGAHDVATNSLVFHVVAASLWVGGLVALLVHLAAGGAHAATAVRRFSRTALVAWVVMAVSGVVNALVRVDPGDLVTSTYGVLVMVKVLALLALGAMGAWHRARMVPAVTAGGAGSRAAMLRFGGVEVLVMFATVGVAVALGRTAPPQVPTALPSRVEALLGYPLDGPFSLAGMVTEARFDLVFGTGALVLAGLYGAGVRRLRRRGDAWSVGRTSAWLGGCLVLLVATSSGVGRYAPALFSVHLAQHVVLAVLVPILWVLGAPVTLLLRTVPSAGAGEPPGPREWVLAAVGSRLARVLTHPLVALALFAGSFFVLYFSGLFDVALSSHWAHLAMDLGFLVVGTLFFGPLLGADTGPRRLPPFVRPATLVVAVVLHALFGLAVMRSSTVIGASFYDQLGLPWVDRVADQTLGGGLAWVGGDVPMLVVLVALLVPWPRKDGRKDRRETRRGDRRADPDGGHELATDDAVPRRRAGPWATGGTVPPAAEGVVGGAAPAGPAERPAGGPTV